MLSTSPLLKSSQLARERWAKDDALAAWLSDVGASEPWYGAVIWRLWLPREHAARLLADLDRYAVPVRLAASFRSEERRVGGDWSSDVCSSDLCCQPHHS